MLSTSRNHLTPAFDQRVSSRTANDEIPEARQLSADQGRLWSFQKPPLPIGSYSLAVEQTVELPSEAASGESKTQKLSLPTQSFRVSGPRFALRDASDIHSVYPAPGQSDYARTLAHVVLSRPTTLWERDIRVNHADVPAKQNRLPWLAVLSFTEDELVLDQQAYLSLGFTEDDGRATGLGAISTKAGVLQKSTQVLSVLNAVGSPLDGVQPEDRVTALLLHPDKFRVLFSGYDDEGRPDQSGKVDLSRFEMMAHVKETHGGFMASSYGDEHKSNDQPRFSVVVSPRTGPPGVSTPTRVVSHLISLEHVNRINPSKEGESRFVGLVSLFSWDWMCVPENEIDFQGVMMALGKSVQPLRVKKDRPPPPLGPASAEKDWLSSKLHAGYVPKLYTLLNGTVTTSLLRGPLIPVQPARNMILAFSLRGEGLTLTDTVTGVADVSYKAAWSLGRSLVMADVTLTSSLLRLRGNIHAEAVRRAKVRALEAKGHGSMNTATYLDVLDASIDQLVGAHNITKLASRRSATARWVRTKSDGAAPAIRLSDASSFTLTDYLDQIDHVANAFFGYSYEDERGNTMPARPIDADAAAVRAWALDQFFLASVPLHCLLPHPNMLPRESIRTFCVDHRWIECVVDGGLSLANHFARGDDTVRRAIKMSINRYLATVRGEGPGKATTLQIPRWGFLMRSTAVTAFPDLKVEALLDKSAPQGVHEVLYMQILADDVLLCLFDRVPGEDGFETIRISQPHHQQGFAIGTRFQAQELRVTFRPVPLKTGEQAPKGESLSGKFEKKQGDRIEVYDWASRLLHPKGFMHEYITALETLSPADKDKIFWPKDKTDPPASLLATQLNTPLLQLTLKLKKNAGPDRTSASVDRWTQPGAQLYVKQRPDSVPIQNQPSSNHKPDGKETLAPPLRAEPDFVKLPTGPRKDIQPVRGSQPPLQNAGKDALQQIKSPPLPFQPPSGKITCFPSYDPGITSQKVRAVESPIDLVFVIESNAQPDGSQPSFPSELEVRIPVSLSSDTYPAGVISDSQQLLQIPGTVTAPVLPIVESVSATPQQWSYRARLAQGLLYPMSSDASLGHSVSPDEGNCVMLVINIRPQGTVKPNTGSFNASFLLRQVKVALPADKGSEHQAKYNVVWYDSNDGGSMPTSISSTQVTVRHAMTLNILDESSYDWEKGLLHLRVHASSVPSMQQGEGVKMQWQPHGLGEEMHMMVPLSPVSDVADTLEGTVSIEQAKAPEVVRLAVVQLKEGREERLGPETDGWVVPRFRGPAELETFMTWDVEYNKLRIHWMPPRRGEALFTITFTVLNTDAEKTPSALTISDDSRSGSMSFDNEVLAPYFVDGSTIWLHEDIHLRHPRLSGLLLSRKRQFTRMSNSVSPKLKTPRRAPTPTTTLAIGSHWIENMICVLHQVWYWTAGGTLALTQIDGRTDTEQFSFAASETGANIGTIAGYCDFQSTVVWIEADGSIKAARLPRSKDLHGPWTTTTLEPVGRACVVTGDGKGGEGALAMAGYRANSAVWWIGPEGDIISRRWIESQIAWEKEATVVAPTGSVRVHGARLPQLRAMWSRNNASNADLLWIGPAGELKLTRRSTTYPEPVTISAVPDADAAPYTSIASIYVASRGYAFWLSRDGAVWGVWADMEIYWGPNRCNPIDGPHMWHKFRLAPPGSAHLRSGLSVTWLEAYDSNKQEAGMLLAWISPSGRLQTATTREDIAGDNTCWSWNQLGPDVQADPNGNLNLAVVLATESEGVPSKVTITYVGGDGHLQCRGVSVG